MGFCAESFVGCCVHSLDVETCSTFSDLFMLVRRLLCFRRASRSMLRQVYVELQNHMFYNGFEFFFDTTSFENYKNNQNAEAIRTFSNISNLLDLACRSLSRSGGLLVDFGLQTAGTHMAIS